MEDEYLKNTANLHLDFLSWNIFSLTAVKQQLKTAPLDVGQAGSDCRVWQPSPTRMKLPAQSGAAAAQPWLIAVKYL